MANNILIVNFMNKILLQFIKNSKNIVESQRGMSYNKKQMMFILILAIVVAFTVLWHTPKEPKLYFD